MKEQEASPFYTAELLEAQQRLLALRERQRLSRDGELGHKAADRDDWLARASRRNGAQTPSNQGHSKVVQETGAAIPELPDHLGWGSDSLTAVLRGAATAKSRPEDCGAAQRLDWIESLQHESFPTLPKEEAEPEPIENELQPVKLQPAVAMGMLRNKLAASGRIWLLLRTFDSAGRGWIEVEQARQLLCDRQSKSRVCGWRQLRNLLKQGHGIFWERRGDRLWLRSTPKAAQALGVKRLYGRPVNLPFKALMQSIGNVRAHFFASFHSGRKKSMPIARATLATISQVSPRTQRNYDRRAGVESQRNFAIGPTINSKEAQDTAWHHGSASFAWRDSSGTYGQQDQTFLAWQLPNSYSGPHQQRPFGRQKQFNRRLADLFTKGKTGNSQSAIEMKPQRFFNAAKSAALAQERSGSAVYWQGSRSGRWYFMAQLGE